MLIREVANPNYEKLVALGQFLVGRAGDTNAKKTVSVATFIEMADNMGVDITADQLKDLSQKEPLKNIIVNIEGDQIVFAGAGQDTTVTDQMTVKQAQDTVEKMAKRASK